MHGFERSVTKSRPTVRPTPTAHAEEAQSSPQEITDLLSALAGLSTTLTHAARDIAILSPMLDHQLFDQDAIVDAISELARRAARSRVRIVIMSNKLIVDRGHRLLDLARRLDDKIQIRLLSEEITADTSTFVCVDRDSYWLLPTTEEFHGVYDLVNPVTARRLRDAFEQAWEKSKSDPELRVLRL